MFIRYIIYLLLIFILLPVKLSAVELKQIIINGNDRIADETIQMFASVSINEEISADNINNILKSIYDSSFFKEVSVNLENNILTINVVENPLIQKIIFNGIKAKKIKEKIAQNLNLKSRSSFNEVYLQKDKSIIQSNLKELGYYFSKIETRINQLDNNQVDIFYEISLGKKAKIKKISFIGDKIFKDKKLKSLIVSEEY